MKEKFIINRIKLRNKLYKAERNVHILELRLSGFTLKEIAVRFKLSPCRINDILKRFLSDAHSRYGIYTWVKK